MEAEIKPDISNEAVAEKTGKTWNEWFAILDDAGATKRSHKEIVALLKNYEQVSAWWQQSITVTYEKARGLRKLHEMAKGFEISVSKTISVPIAALFNKILDDAQRRQWLQYTDTSVRKATENKTIRLNWPESQLIEVRFVEKKTDKTQVTVQHTKLPNAEKAAELKLWWKECLADLV